MAVVFVGNVSLSCVKLGGEELVRKLRLADGFSLVVFNHFLRRFKQFIFVLFIITASVAKQAKVMLLQASVSEQGER